jgi:rRNA pseudouridine-1189 N-methylase Emg1 (Nep1/Mra1 family)
MMMHTIYDVFITFNLYERMPQTPERFDNAIYRFLYIDAIYRNDLEKHRDEMECGELISNYVTALRNIFWRTKKVLET